MAKYLVNHGSRIYHIVKNIDVEIRTECNQVWCSLETSWLDKAGKMITTYFGGHPLARLYDFPPPNHELCKTCLRNCFQKES